jgi:hypothetical protein
MSMASEKQIAANRMNAQKSTGPRTKAGKAVARYNALTHGLTAALVVSPDEDSAEFATFQEQIFAELSPESMLQAQIAADFVGVQWRLRRLPKWIAALSAYHMFRDEFQDCLVTMDAVQAAKATVTERLKKRFPDRSTEEIQALLKLGERLVQDGFAHHERILRHERGLRREADFLLKQLDKMKREQAATLDHEPIELGAEGILLEDTVAEAEPVDEAELV